MKLTAEVIRRLARLAETDRSVLSVYLDTKPGWDGIKSYVTDECARLRPLLSNQEKDFFETSISFLNDYLETLQERNVHCPGLAFFADLGADYVQGIELDIAPMSLVALDDEAIIHPLALLLDEYEPIGVIMLDASSARILITAGQAIEDAATLRTRIHHLSKKGGWSQMRYQRRRAKQVHHYLQDVSRSALEIFRSAGVQRVLLAGRDRMVTALMDSFPKEWQERIIATIRWDLDKGDREFLARIRPLLEEAERDQEKRLLEHLLAELRRSGLAVAGVEPTRNALQRGQVDTLFILQDTEPDKTEELVSLAQVSGAYVEYLPATNERMKALGSCAALLRYRTGV